ncbi:MAG: YSC84-related protein [Geminicoccaceae bacterium]
MSMYQARSVAFALFVLLAGCSGGNPLDTSSNAEKSKALVSNSTAALDQLYRDAPGAQDIGKNAKGILVFPSIVKAGLGIGGETGNGTLFINDEASGYFNKSGASFGFQAGAQKRSEVIMFMTDAAMQKLKNRAGLEFGVDASAAVLDAGAGGTLDTSNIDAEIVAFIFGQAGLMANASLEGSKVTEINLDP